MDNLSFVLINNRVFLGQHKSTNECRVLVKLKGMFNSALVGH